MSIVAIGASAGGLEAIEAFLARVDPKSGAAYVVVQHLDPTKPAGLVELLQRATPLPVEAIRDGTPVRRDRVYVIPPGVELAMLHGTFQLLEPSAPRGQRLPIDGFFRSIADELGTRAVAVVLSGMGSDGLLGVEYLRERGGLVAVQDPASAAFDSMPQAIVDAGLADIVAPPADLPERIAWYLAHGVDGARATRDREPVDQGGILEKVTVLLRRHGGNDFSLYKRTTLRRRIERRMAIHQIESPAAYLRYLQRNPAEVALLFKELLIGVTSFFRDPEAWEVLGREVLPALIRSLPEGGVLRAWVPACSTGEEAYSLAIAFREALAAVQPDHPVTLQIFATDLNDDAIGVARMGSYSANIEATVSAARRQQFFARERGGYRIHKDVRAMITFATHNVTTDPPFTRLDLLVCRNLLIYLTADVQRRLMPVFHYALNPGGYLFLGTAESAADPEGLFGAVDPKARLFRRLEAGRATATREVRFRPAVPMAGAPEAPVVGRPASLHAAASDYMLGRHGPASLLIDAGGEIVWLSGRAHEYLEPATGQATWSAGAMIRASLRPDVLRAVRQAAKQPGEVRHLIAAPEGGRGPSVEATAQRLREPGPLDGLILVTFRDEARAPASDAVAPAKGARRGAGDRQRHGDAELRRALADAREAREALQATREELGSTLEEMQSTNEELQSTNEELTTSKEELQSMNEELQTINAEQVARMESLAQAQSDMNNLLNSTEIATLFLGPGLAIRRFTSGATSVYRLLPGDVGRPITDIVSDLEYGELATDAHEVLRTLLPRERELQARGGRWFQVRVLPYRTIDDVIDGVVVTFTDITAAKRLEHRLRERERQLHAFVHHAPAAILVVDAAGVVRECNAEGARLFGRPRDEILGRPLADLPLPPGFGAHVAACLQRAEVGDAPGMFAATFTSPDGRTVPTQWVAGGIRDPDADGLVLMGFALDLRNGRTR